jgi:cobalt-precorrin 5A hydrolase
MTAEPPLIVAGIGCRRGCPVVDIVAAVREAERRAGCRADALAAPGFKQGEAALPAAAAELGLPLHWVGDAELARAQPGCVTRSAVAARATGFAAIAEAAALAGTRTLLLPRITFGAATCALSTVAVDTQPAAAFQ